MSWTNLKKRTVKARKEHHCNWCHSRIKKGEVYTFSTNVTEGNIHDWKECDRCKDLVKEMFDMGYGDEFGYCDDDSFSEFMEIEYDTTFHDYINLRLPKFLQVKEQEGERV